MDDNNLPIISSLSLDDSVSVEDAINIILPQLEQYASQKKTINELTLPELVQHYNARLDDFLECTSELGKFIAAKMNGIEIPSEWRRRCHNYANNLTPYRAQVGETFGTIVSTWIHWFMTGERDSLKKSPNFYTNTTNTNGDECASEALKQAITTLLNRPENIIAMSQDEYTLWQHTSPMKECNHCHNSAIDLWITEDSTSTLHRDRCLCSGQFNMCSQCFARQFAMEVLHNMRLVCRDPKNTSSSSTQDSNSNNNGSVAASALMSLSNSADRVDYYNQWYYIPCPSCTGTLSPKRIKKFMKAQPRPVPQYVDTTLATTTNNHSALSSPYSEDNPLVLLIQGMYQQQQELIKYYQRNERAQDATLCRLETIAHRLEDTNHLLRQPVSLDLTTTTTTTSSPPRPIAPTPPPPTTRVEEDEDDQIVWVQPHSTAAAPAPKRKQGRRKCGKCGIFGHYPKTCGKRRGGV